MNILLIAIFTALVVFLTFQWLGLYTMHGDSITVPSVQGKSLDEIEILLANSDMTYEVTDSIFSDEYPKGTVVSQTPEAGDEVKQGRTIYLTLNRRLIEMVTVPDIIGKSKRIAVTTLEISGLRLNSLRYKPDESCTDCVVGLEYMGEEVSPNEKLVKGSRVNLILGQSSNVPTTTPDLLGLTYSEAYQLIISSSLNMGSIVYCEGCESAEDSAKAFVVNQRPMRNEMTNLGSFVDLYLTTDTSEVNGLQQLTDTIANEE
jgi:beta-lactam-binding protein with PASTA domain